MDLRDYLGILRARWILILLTTLGVIAVAAGLTWSATPQYASSSRLFISTSGSTDAGEANQGS